jgi:hypothetical protein
MIVPSLSFHRSPGRLRLGIELALHGGETLAQGFVLRMDE